MNIKYKRHADNEEMAKVYEFINRNKNLIVAAVVLIALIIIGTNLYRKSVAEGRITAADKLFEISNYYDTGEYGAAVTNGTEYIDKYAGYESTGDIVILVARSYMAQGKTQEAINILESNKSAAENGPFKFAVFNLLGGLYMDLWMKEKNSDYAQKAGEFYLKAAYSDNESHKDKTLYYAGDSFIQAGNLSKAKEVLKPLYDNSRDLEYQLRQQVEYLYESIN